MTVELVLSLVSIFVAISAFVLPLVINSRYRAKDKQESLDKRLDTIIQLGIEYPYLEDNEFTSKWEEMKDKREDPSFEKYQRYDNYCNIVFNFLHSVCEHYKYDKEKVENYVDIKDWVRTHQSNWKHPIAQYENVDGYDEPFRKFIKSYLN